MKRASLALLVALALLLPNAGDVHAGLTSVVGASLQASIADVPSARVVVLFNGDDLSLTDLGARSKAIADRREAVLDQIDPREFRVTDTFARTEPVLANAFHLAHVPYRWKRGTRERLPEVTNDPSG